jgi:hypothetical protein
LSWKRSALTFAAMATKIMRMQKIGTVAILALTVLTAALWSWSAEPKAGSVGKLPMLALLSRFTAPDVPVLGPGEVALERSWPDPVTAVERPGGGLTRHPMLYAGEGYNNLLLVNDGKVIWNYFTGAKGEVDDVWMLSNGNVLFARQWQVEEVTPKKEIVWHYDVPAGSEVHSCQPIGLDRVLIVQNGLPPKLIVLNKRTGKVEVEHELPAASLTDPKTVHPQFRRIRVTARGTYLVPFLKLDKVVEYDKQFREIWSCPISTPWAAARLHNGNTLVTDERDKLVRELDSKCGTVWEFSEKDLPVDVVFHNTQSAERLANGNTVIFISTGGTKHEERPGIIQAVEVTPDKKLVWVLQDWKNLGPATTAQFLDQPGVPEKPGELQR